MTHTPGSLAGVRFPVLDGVRGLAVLMVLLLHFTFIPPSASLDGWVAGLLQSGWVGVDLFFVLSGFLITGILYDSRGEPGFFRNFYGRRALRILPLYYAYLALVFLVLPALFAGYAAEHAGSDRRIWFWTHLGNILMARDGWEAMPSHTTHLWSLAVEEQFYLVWPLVVFLLPRHLLRGACGALFVGALATRLVLIARAEAPGAYVLMPARMDTLVAGAYMAVLLRERGSEATRVTARRILAGGAAMVAAASAGSLLESHELLAPLAPATQSLGYSGLSLAFAGMVGLAVTGTEATRLARTLQTRGLRFLGKYSYGLYVLHVPLRNAFRSQVDAFGGLPLIAGSQLPAQAAVTVVGVGISIGIALLSWTLLESPFLAMKKHFEPGHAAHPPADVVAPV